MSATFNRRSFLQTVAAGSVVMALPRTSRGDHGGMHRYCIAVSVVDGDTKQALKDLMDGVDAKLIGRNPDPGDPETFEYYVLGTGGVAATTLDGDGNPLEIEVGVVIGLNQNVANNVLVELRKQNSAYRQIAFNPPESRATIEGRVRQIGGESGCDHIWILKPGDSTVTLNNAALLAKFQPI